MREPPARDWLTIAEAAHQLGLQPDSLRKTITRGTLTARTVGRRSVVSTQEVERYRQEHLGTGAWQHRRQSDYVPSAHALTQRRYRACQHARAHEKKARGSSSWRLRSPDWDALIALLDAVCRAKGLLTRSGTPSYPQLARACGLSADSLSAWRRDRQRPSRATLEKLAAYAGQPLGPWLTAAGLDEPEAPTPATSPRNCEGDTT